MRVVNKIRAGGRSLGTRLLYYGCRHLKTGHGWVGRGDWPTKPTFPGLQGQASGMQWFRINWGVVI